MTAQDITMALANYYPIARYTLATNCYAIGWEADFLAMSKAGYLTEVEIKVSLSDFRADFTKPKHRCFQAGGMPYDRGCKRHVVPHSASIEGNLVWSDLGR